MYGDHGYYESFGGETKKFEKRLVEIASIDERPGTGVCQIVTRDKELLEIVEIRDGARRLGAIAVRVHGETLSGRLRAHGVSLFTDTEIRQCQE